MKRRMMGILAAVAGTVLLLVAMGALAFMTVGPERIWRIAGPPDLGDVASESLQRRTTPNDALACPPDLCRARSDLEAPVFDMGAGDLRTAFRSAMESEPRLERVAEDDGALSERYVQRSDWLRFPDTIVVRFYGLSDRRSTVAIYSRSQIGRGDMGVNRARIERWLEKLRQRAKPSIGNPG